MRKIYNALIRRDYLNDDDCLTEKFHDDTLNGALDFGEELEPCRADNVEIKLDEEKLRTKNFLELWSRISPKRFYRVDGDNFTSSAIVERSANALNRLNVPENYFVVERGTLNYDAEFAGENHRAESFQFADVTKILLRADKKFSRSSNATPTESPARRRARIST